MMKIEIAPEIERPDVSDQPQTQTKPQRSDGWFTRIQRRVKLAMEGDEEDLLIINTTMIPWHIYHNFRMLGILDSGEEHLFRLQKRGKLGVRPHLESDAVEYLVLDLDAQVQRVEIYRQHLGQGLETYEMRAA
ncbi:MAG: hypothetical protein ACRDHZ_02865 [Ktedonobacteraceae bacterium]